MPNDAVVEEPTADYRPLRQLLFYDGTIGDLYRIYLVNLLLTIVTLGIWRFWGITRLRRYVWSRTSMMEDRFEYDGTGLQLFLSFMLAGAVLAGMVFAAAIASLLLRHTHPRLAIAPIGVMEFIIVVLALGAPFAAQRYRLGHTMWRGIRGGMEGSAVQYGLRSMAYYIFAAITLYQLLPWATLRLRERLIDASFLGDLRFHARGRARRLYLVFLATFAGVIVLAAVVAGAVFLLDASGMHAISASTHRAPHAPLDPELGRAVRHAIYFIIAGYIAFFVGGALISCVYTAAFWRHLLGNTNAGDIRFGSTVRAKAVFMLIAGNFLILVFTLGLGYPFLIQRNVRFFTVNLLATGGPDTATLRQSDRPVPTLGEGMFQQLDGGAGFL